MKNSNLLNRLLSYSHEKQKPQRFARYAAMLIMLLTLGVGQMWAKGYNGESHVYLNVDGTTKYYKVSTESWSTGASLPGTWGGELKNQTFNNIHTLELKGGAVGGWTNSGESLSGTLYYKITANSTTPSSGWTSVGSINSNSTYNGSNCFYYKNNYSTNVTPSEAGTYYLHIKITDGDSNNRTSYVKFTIPSYTVAGSSAVLGTDWSVTDTNNDMVWSNGTTYTLTKSNVTLSTGTTYECKVALNHSWGTSYPGSNKQFTVAANGHYDVTFSFNASSKAVDVTTTRLYAVIYNDNGKTSGSVPATSYHANGATVTVASNSGSLAKTGYTFDGWNTANDGSGSNYTAGSGTFTKTTSTQTLYARWLQTITVEANTGSSAGSMSIYFNAGSLTSFTAAEKTDWILDSYWTTADESGSKVIDYDASTGTASLVSSLSGYITTGKWTRTTTTKLYAHWKQTYTVTYNANYPASATSTSGSVPTDATEYASGATVTVKSNSGSLAAGGYTFAGWQTEPTGGTSYVAGSGTFSITEPTTLYAKWTENMTTVTVSVSPSGSGTLTVGGAAHSSGNTTTAGVATNRTVVVTPYPGYRFSSWGTTGNATGTSSTNTYTLKGNGSGSTGTLTATQAQTYAYLQGRMTIRGTLGGTKKHIASSEGGWDVSSNRIKMDYDGTNHRFYLHTYMTPKELSTAQTDGEQYFHFKTSTSSSSDDTNAQVYNPSTGRTLTAAGTGNKKETGSSDGSNNIWFDDNSTTNGYAIIYFDEAGVWYEVEHSLAYNVNGGSGTLPSTTCHLHGNNGTVGSGSSINKSQFTFSGWNTSQYITGTSYAAGDAITMNANTTLYAKWTRSITLNQNGGANGSSSVTATYNCSTLPSITNPGKDGYTFGGWNTANDGSGSDVINTSGALQVSVSNWTNANSRFTRTSSGATLYAKWTQTITLNYNASYHGSGSNKTATILLNAGAVSSITHCTPATGYQLEGYYSAATGGVKILNADGSFAGTDVAVSTDDYIVGGAWVHAGNTTLYAHYTAKTYDVILDVNGATSGSDQTVVATFDAAMPTTQKTSGAAITAPSKTGYNFGGYFANNTGTGTQYYTNALASNHIWDVATNNTHIYAKWTAKTTDITLDQTGAATTGSVTTRTGTYDAAMPAISGANTLPVAPQGYAFMGYYDALEPLGNKYYNDDGTSARTWNKEDAEVTLYAYFKNAEVTGITLSDGVVAPSTSITATPTISPTPEETTKVCWEIQYSNGTPLPSQPTFTPGVGNAVSFSAPAASATYRLQATLRTGSSCGGGDELSTYYTTFQVAGEHTVTIRYQDGDGRTLKDTIHITARPLAWTTLGAITPPTITGYTFDHWDAGDGVTIKNGDSDPVTTTTTSSIQIKANYDGTLTAVYTKKRMIYFYNTLGWGSVYVYFYKNDSYWQTVSPYNGSGANTSFSWTSTPYSEGKHGQMLPVSEGSNIYYFDAEAAGVNASYDDVVFTEHQQHGYDYFYQTNAVRRGDYKSSMPMFVPLADQTADPHNETNYYNNGYWMNYPENTGYTLKIYNEWNANRETAAVQSIAFPYSEDLKMPLKMDVELSDGYNHDYWFMVYRNDGTYWGNEYHFKQGYNAEQIITNVDKKSKITTSAPGNYTFTLTYHDNGSGTVNYYIDVDFPIATGDYRIYYSDNATWSKAAHTKDNWCHPSHSIGKATTEVKKDTVSFYIPKGEGILHTMKFQKASVTDDGVVSWTDSVGGGITIPSSVNATGVYNFIFTQPAGGSSISLEKVEPYTGNFYIRTDCAGNTKWDSFKNVDHQMTYSDYAEKNSGYSHYYAHWVEKDNNIKFTIANDYSMCITDTLIEDYGTVVADISNVGALNSASASIRFMWDQATNKISRAYISGSSIISDRFLVLEGDAKMFDENGNALNIDGLNANEINLVDDQNFVYERTIQVNTKARAKLTAKYNENVQYFKGSEGAFAEETTIELLGGNASGKHTMRIVYDFKTNRLVTAYVPSEIIEDHIAINADLMIVREHQEAGQQLLFNEGSLSEVHTVYGVMRFNRWTLNNKEKSVGHSVVDDPKSAYERGLYWISFPFDVNLSDVFGFGTYGTHWILMEYNGAKRATEGYWADSKGFWEYVMPSQRSTFTMNAGKGYILALDLDLMKDNNEDFWSNSIEQVELFFPSASYVSNIAATNVSTTVDPHVCTINRHTQAEKDAGTDTDINKNRTVVDSHWNIIGVPSYANYGTTLKNGSDVPITWNANPESDNLPFLYEWNMVDNTYTPQTGTTYPFKSMHAYIVQYNGTLKWTLASATPATPAPRRYEGALKDVEYRLELQQNEKMVDQAFVKMSNDENVSAGFSFDEDLCKEYNANKANIYTFIEGYIPAAGNTLPMSDQTTVVPVGVKIATNGEYTFAMPDGTDGIGITLVDNETGIRTPLSALDYTVNLSAGTYNKRFVLEISPIHHMPTGIENSEVSHQHSDVRKVLIDGILYIVKDGKMFDARGALVK